MDFQSAQKIVDTCTCAVCGGGLAVGLTDGGESVFICPHHPDHHGYTKVKSAYRLWREGEPVPLIVANRLQEKERERMTTELGKEAATSLAKYEGVRSLTKADATTILKTIWPKAPDIEVQKAAIRCMQYGLNPLRKHLALLSFTNHKTGEVTWATVESIEATRLIASRKHPYSYTDGPRMMTDKEQEEIRGIVDSLSWWAVTELECEGRKARGYGSFPKFVQKYQDGKPVYKDGLPVMIPSEAYGAEKGNSPQNMAMLRSERQAFNRLLPADFPGDVEVMEGAFMDVTPSAISQKTRVKTIAPSSDTTQDGAGAAGVGIEGKDVEKRDPTMVKTLGDLMKACHTDFGMQQKEVLAELGVDSVSGIVEPPAACYARIAAVRN